MRISVIATVLNEAESLPDLLDSLAAQTRAPDEVIFCDGGSRDSTLSLLEAESRFPVCIVQRPGANISQGRNEAIGEATGDIIAATDAGVRLSPHWLERVSAPFEHPATQGVAGFFLPDFETAFETAMGATVLPALQKIDPSRFNPSSRSVAFRKSAWAEVGGYPEWLDYCEDLVFDFRLRERYGPFIFAPEALVYFRPRSSLRAFCTQYYHYARGDGKADLWRSRHAVRYLTYVIALPLIAAAGLLTTPWWWALSLVAIPGMFLTGWRRLVQLWGKLGPSQKLLAMMWVPVIRVTGDIAKMVGYPAGVWWRWKHRAEVPDWRRA